MSEEPGLVILKRRLHGGANLGRDSDVVGVVVVAAAASDGQIDKPAVLPGLKNLTVQRFTTDQLDAGGFVRAAHCHDHCVGAVELRLDGVQFLLPGLKDVN